VSLLWALGAWLVASLHPFVFARAGSDSALYAGGRFTPAGGSLAINIAKWNKSSWSALGAAMNGPVRALAASGGDLYAGGEFTTAGGVSADAIAKWNGNSWSALDSGVSDGPSLPPPSLLAVSGRPLCRRLFHDRARCRIPLPTEWEQLSRLGSEWWS
jgi:hypothetical protein